MIRQAHTYLVGALSSVTLIGIAIAVFAVLVSAQVFHDWPIAGLGGHQEKTAVAPAKALPASDTEKTAATGGATASTAKVGGGATTASATGHASHHRAKSDSGTAAHAPGTSVEGSTPSGGGGESSSSGNSGSDSSQPSPSSPGSSSSEGSGGSSSSSGGGATGSSGGSGSGSSGGGSSGGGGSTTTPTEAKTPKPSETISEGLNETVHNVDEAALGGTLEKTGVTEVTETVVNGVVGPESVVGKVVDGAGEAVSGLLGGKGQ